MKNLSGTLLKIICLSINLDLRLNIFSISEDRISSTLLNIQSTINTLSYTTARNLAKTCCKIISSKFVPGNLAQLKTRNHNRAINEFIFWNKNLIKLNSKVFIQYQIPKLIVSSDASNTGVAAYFTENCKQNVCYRNLSSE